MLWTWVTGSIFNNRGLLFTTAVLNLGVVTPMGVVWGFPGGHEGVINKPWFCLFRWRWCHQRYWRGYEAISAIPLSIGRRVLINRAVFLNFLFWGGSRYWPRMSDGVVGPKRLRTADLQGVDSNGWWLCGRAQGVMRFSWWALSVGDMKSEWVRKEFWSSEQRKR